MGWDRVRLFLSSFKGIGRLHCLIKITMSRHNLEEVVCPLKALVFAEIFKRKNKTDQQTLRSCIITRYMTPRISDPQGMDPN